ncbi:MAG: indole-3-glycerol phosphate synthase TrpC [Acidimicrobiia bacterium]|nr:indole-3-glycerol phosphate synthase TrpC [Acidimicrobiia bacterium]
MTVLDRILTTKRDEVTVLRHPQTRDLLRATALDAPPTRDFRAALRRADAHPGLIAEIKRRSPSKGDLAPDLDPAAFAAEYAAGGATALSVLTDAPYFGGAIADLQAAREAVDLPVLRKDFILDEVQVYESRAVGADAVLLILSALPDDSLVDDLAGLAAALGLAVLVEAHDDAEVARGVALGAAIIGVNARNLGTFAEDLDGSVSLIAGIPAGTIAVAESAIRTPDDAARMAEAGFDALLVGEALVRSPDASTLARSMVAATVVAR